LTTKDSSAALKSIDARITALHDKIMRQLDDDQAVEIVSIPLAGKSSIADFMIVASGKSGRQVASMATKIAEMVKAETGRPVRLQGLPTADWVLIDAGDIIVHVFRPEVRAFYNLEKMWSFKSLEAQAEEKAAAKLAAKEAKAAARAAAAGE
jgi:ribosome-associated protein